MPKSDTQNLLLAALPKREFAKIEHSLKLVNLKVGQVLWEINEKRRYVYFPVSALVCFLYETENGTSIEVGMTGRQGMVGIVTFFGDSIMAKRAVVESAGQAYVMKAKDVEDHFAKSPDFEDICMSYTQTLIAQISQSAICNGLHSIEQRLCRYLLVVSDSIQGPGLVMTQTRISEVLGVRRESVSVTAAQLQNNGLIKYERGKITILDRKGLLATVCECYTSVRAQYDRILSKYISQHDA